MSKYNLELLTKEHDRKNFHCGRQTLENYLKQTARGHAEKNISVTRILTTPQATPPKPIIGYFTLSQISIETTHWETSPKGLPKTPIPAILLSRIAVHTDHQRQGISRLLISSACKIALAAIQSSGGIGIITDAAEHTLIPYYKKFGFTQIENLRLFLPTKTLQATFT